MRASLWLFATLSLLCSPLAAELTTEAAWETWRDNAQWSANMAYSASPLADWLVRAQGETLNQTDGSFDRDSRSLRLRWLALRQWRGWSGGVVLETRKTSDKSLSGAGKYAYTRLERSAGLRLETRLVDNLTFDNEWRWGWREDESSNLSGDRNFHSDGLRGESALNWRGAFGANHLAAGSALDYADIEQDRGIDTRHFLQWSADLGRHAFTTNFELSDNAHDIYQDFSRTDRQRRTDWRIVSDYATSSLPVVATAVHAEFDRLDNRYDDSDSRDYTQGQRSLALALTAPARDWIFRMEGRRAMLDREYSDQSHDLQQEEWMMSGEAAWAFTPRDTLRFVRSARLLRSDMPHASLRTDNDLLENAWSLQGGWFIRDRILMRGDYDWLRSERVYIDSRMSGENSARTRHLAQPVLSVAAGRGFLVEQSYTLLADYVDYRWNNDRADRFYRQLTGEWRVAWDQSLSLAYVSDIVWPTLADYAAPGWAAEASYRYIHSEGGDWEDDSYLIDDEQERHEATLQASRHAAWLDWTMGAEMVWTTGRELRLPIQATVRWQGVDLDLRVTPQCDVENLPPGETDWGLPYPRLTRELEWQANILLRSSF